MIDGFLIWTFLEMETLITQCRILCRPLGDRTGKQRCSKWCTLMNHTAHRHIKPLGWIEQSRLKKLFFKASGKGLYYNPLGKKTLFYRILLFLKSPDRSTKKWKIVWRRRHKQTIWRNYTSVNREKISSRFLWRFYLKKVRCKCLEKWFFEGSLDRWRLLKFFSDVLLQDTLGFPKSD